MSTTKKPPSPSNCYGYCRVSTGAQRESGLSIDDQQRKIQARCLEMGWELAATFTDAGVSGSTPLGKRPQGARLLAALRPGDTIICSRMDRMFRSSLDALATIQSFKKRKISEARVRPLDRAREHRLVAQVTGKEQVGAVDLTGDPVKPCQLLVGG